MPGEDFEFPKRFTAELERFDIGLILMWKYKKTWNFQVLEWETDRLSPDPAELNGLLQTFFQQSKRKREFMHLVVIFLLGLVLYNVWHVNVRQPAQGTGPTTIALPIPKNPAEAMEWQVIEQDAGKSGDTELANHYQQVNERHFDGRLPGIPVLWEPRLKEVRPLIADDFRLEGLADDENSVIQSKQGVRPRG